MNEELIINMGENEDKQQDKQQEQAIRFALLDQRVISLERWKDAYEKAQQDKFERMQEENKNERIKFEDKLDKFMEGLTKQIGELTSQLNEQKSNWFNKAPWWLTGLITGLCSTLIGLAVYLVTKN